MVLEPRAALILPLASHKQQVSGTQLLSLMLRAKLSTLN